MLTYHSACYTYHRYHCQQQRVWLVMPLLYSCSMHNVAQPTKQTMPYNAVYR